ncbi:MAG: insulinase family protein [Spirochaetes bacterium]|uniref:Insulinase family protein n=1 Tax=Candidatus Ornithospirochaeta stercoripullorum TaxID=2840899 RepID=A0A9D9DZ30_9SPIO|nr:insulinase family protein [Candidatus Ornithospirochaeta stercoripullorum]
MHEFRVGDRIAGFVVRKISSLQDYRAEGILLEHERTCFPVFYVDSYDNEKFFSYTAYTPSENSKGIPHIIEHTVLSGSRKYPVKDPFMILVRNSCNTFLNALTGVDRTYFPGASTVEKDFRNLFSVYSDAVFSPLLREETFMQEGIRISSSGGLHFEGVVFSEMLGEMAEHEYVLSSASTKPLFGVSPYRFESGGDAREICKLTYEEYLAFYKKHYVPANLSLFLYGNMEIEPLLKLLDDEYLSKREAGAKVERIGLAERWSEPRSYEAVSSAEEGDAGASVMLSWLLGDNAKPGESTLLSLIVDILLGSPGCPLYKAIAESDLGKDLSTESGMSSSYRELVFSAGFSGSDPDDAKKIESFILSTLEEIARRGLDRKAIEAAIRRMEFSLKEIPGGIPQGMRLFFQAEKGLTFGIDPALFLAPSSIIGSIRSAWRDNPRFFEDWIMENLVSNPHRLLTVVRKDSEEGNVIEEAIAKVLEERKGEYSAEKELSFNRFQTTPDSQEAIAQIPRLARTDLPYSFDRISHTYVDGVVAAPMASGGIVYTDLVFDISDFSYRELDAANVLSRLYSMCNLPEMSYSDFSTELRFVSGGYAFYVESGSTSDGKEKVFFVCRLKSLPDLQWEGLNLFMKLLFEGVLDDEARIKAALVDISTDFASSIVQNGHTYASALAASALSPSLYIGERLSGVTCWYTISRMLNDSLKTIGSELIAVRDKMLCRERMMIHVTADSDLMENSISVAASFKSRFASGGGVGKAVHAVPQLSRFQARTLSSSVSFTALSGRAPGFADSLSSKERIFLSIISQTAIWSAIREKGGAYGAGAYLDNCERNFIFYSYRDPRLDETIRDFLDASSDAGITAERLEDAVIGVLARDLKPMAPAVRSLVDIRRMLYRISDSDRERIRKEILSLSIPDVEEGGRKLKDALDKNEWHVAFIGDRKALEASSYDWQTESLPQ